MKKYLSLLLSMVLVLVMAAGCSSPGATGNENPTDAETSSNPVSSTDSDGSSTSSEDVTITFGFWGDTEEAEMKMALAKAYMEEHPNVTIEFEYTDGAGYLTKMQTWFSSGTVPDVFGVPSDTLFQFMGNEYFEDLSSYIESDGLAGKWNMDTVESVYTADGVVYAAPFISKVFAIAYNKTLFDEAGLEYPTDDWTEEDMLEYARALTSGTGTDKTYGIRWGVRPTEFYRNLYGNPVYDVGTNKMNAIDNEQFKHAVALFADTIKEGLAPDETSAAISTGGFETGQFAMQLCATWDIATFQDMIGDSFEWDIVMLPNNTEFDTRMLSTYRGNGWSMSSTAVQKEVCWDFIKFMTVNEESQKAAQSFGIPELLSLTTSDEYLNDFGGGTPYDKQVFINMLDYTTSFYNLGVYAEINDVIKTQYELLLADKITIDELLEEVQTQGEALFAASE